MPVVIGLDSITREILTVKFSIPQILRAFVVLGLMLAITGSVADAQQMGLPYDGAPIPPQVMNNGSFYIAGGARWRQGQKVSFAKTSVSGGYSVPFGPKVPGNFRFGRANNNGGVWIYDNGTINPNNPQTSPSDSAYGGSSSLGALVYQSTPPISWTYYNVGSFTVNTINQFTPLIPLLAPTFGNVTQITYDLAFNQSPDHTVTDNGFNSLVFNNSAWCPYIEIGFWSGWSVLSFSYSFQAFRFNNTFQKNIDGTFYPFVNSLTDTYDFSSIGFNSDGTRAPSNPALVSAPFTSIRQGTSGTVQYSYTINPLSGNRVYKNNGVEVTPLPIIENLSVSLDASCYENRLGLLFMEQSLSQSSIGFSFGPVATRVHSTLNYQNIIPNPDNPDNPDILGGSLVKDRWHYGAFGSLDLRMSSRSVFFSCSFDYVFMPQIGQSVDDIQCAISPGGYSISTGGGLNF